jgi:hypothetical protein
MSFAPEHTGPIVNPYMRYAVVYVLTGRQSGSLEALFTNKTFADRCCNSLNDLGDPFGQWKVKKLFERPS